MGTNRLDAFAGGDGIAAHRGSARSTAPSRPTAHERIIGERQVANKDKILSLYESDAHVIVRGKAGAEVEFGNSLFLAEQRNGFIVDHELSQHTSPGDAKWLAQRLDKLAPQGDPAKLSALFSDRGFASKSNSAILEANDIFDGLCPRNPDEMGNKMKNEIFATGQTRRAQTEGRVGVLSNGLLDAGKPRAKGFAHRQIAVQWAVLSHNLRVLARIRQREQAARTLRSVWQPKHGSNRAETEALRRAMRPE